MIVFFATGDFHQREEFFSRFEYFPTMFIDIFRQIYDIAFFLTIMLFAD